MELEAASSFFPSLQIYKGTSPVCTGFDPLADIAIENVVSIEDPDFAFVSEHDANKEVEETEEDKTPTLLASMDTQAATVIHDVNILEDTKPVVSREPNFS